MEKSYKGWSNQNLLSSKEYEMNNALLAVLTFVAVIGGLALFFTLAGRFSFWKLASRFPDEAIRYMESDPAWVFADDCKKPPGYSGPFFLRAPSMGRTLKFYGDADRMEESQAKFVELYSDAVPDQGFPYLSFVALIYPVFAMLSMYNTAAPVVIVLGYGFANLGYLLVAAGVFAGQFRTFSLEGRIPTIVAAVVAWVLGMVMFNVA